MQVEAAIIKVSDNHIDAVSVIDTLSFTDYDCCNDFCKCFFDKQHKECTLMAHNGAGYANKLILQWCVKHGLNPGMLIRQGSRFTYMHFNKNNIIFIDTLHLPLKD